LIKDHVDAVGIDTVEIQMEELPEFTRQITFAEAEEM
jgi:hypothetical protein